MSRRVKFNSKVLLFNFNNRLRLHILEELSSDINTKEEMVAEKTTYKDPLVIFNREWLLPAEGGQCMSDNCNRNCNCCLLSTYISLIL